MRPNFVRVSGGIYTATCLNCNFKFSDIYDGQSIDHYACFVCKTFVQIKPIPFRLNPPPCSTCGTQLKYSQRIVDISNKTGPCPNCGEHSIDLVRLGEWDGEKPSPKPISQLLMPGMKIHALFDGAPWAIGRVKLVYDHRKARLSQPFPELALKTIIEGEVVNVVSEVVYLKFLNVVNLDEI